MTRRLTVTAAALLLAIPCGADEPEPTPATATLTTPTADLVRVAVPRELRGLWVATVVNLDFPTRPGLSPDALRAELDAIVDGAHELGFNALVFQVRAEGDALYDSAFEPWSRYLTGTQGDDPGMDPLAYLIEIAHAQGLEVHAWFNPYRLSLRTGLQRADKHASRWAAAETRTYGQHLWLDPGTAVARDLAVTVVQDVTQRYDIDGVHLDDYFYPYPNDDQPFPDDAPFQAYQAAGGLLVRDAWRRHNVDTLVHQLSDVVHETRPDCRFGISPFGIYRPGQPAGVTGMDQVAKLHADPLRWYDEGWVDYLAPQLYWPTTQRGHPYGALLDWWDAHSTPERPLIVGLAVHKVGTGPAWTRDELRQQITLARDAPRTAGEIWFRARFVLNNQGGLADVAREVYATPALPPPLVRRMGTPVPPPDVSVAGDHLVIAPGQNRRAVVLYQQVNGVPEVRDVLPGDTHEIAVESGTWVVSAVARHGGESLGVRVTAP